MLPLRDDPPGADRGAAGVRRTATPRSTTSGTARSSRPEIKGFTVDGSEGFERIAGVTEEQDRKYYAITVRPQVFINLIPDHVIMHRMFPMAVDRTVVECDWLFAPDLVAAGRDLTRSVELFDRVNRQDFEACERCQPAMASRVYRDGGCRLHARLSGPEPTPRTWRRSTAGMIRARTSPSLSTSRTWPSRGRCQ